MSCHKVMRFFFRVCVRVCVFLRTHTLSSNTSFCLHPSFPLRRFGVRLGTAARLACSGRFGANSRTSACSRGRGEAPHDALPPHAVHSATCTPTPHCRRVLHSCSSYSSIRIALPVAFYRDQFFTLLFLDLFHTSVMLVEVQTCTTDYRRPSSKILQDLFQVTPKPLNGLALFSTSPLCFDTYARLQKVITSPRHTSTRTDVTYIVTRTVWKKEQMVPSPFFYYFKTFFFNL